MVLSLFSGKEASVPELIAKKKFAQAVTILRDQLKSRPDDTGLLIQLADVLALDNKGKQAVPILEKAADQLTAEGFTTKAIAALKRIERLDPASSLRVKAKLDSLVKPMEPPPVSSVVSAPVIAIDIDLDDSEPALDLDLSPVAEPAPTPTPAPTPAPAPPPEPEPQPDFFSAPEPVPDFLAASEPPPPDFFADSAPPPDFAPVEAAPVPFVSFGDEPEDEPAIEVTPEPEPVAEVEEIPMIASVEEVEDVLVVPEPAPVVEAFLEMDVEPVVEAVIEPEEPEPIVVATMDEVEEAPSAGNDLEALLDAAVDAVEADAEEEVAAEAEEEKEPGAFSSLSQEEMAAVVQGLDLQTYEPGDIIVSEGEPGDSMFVIASGSVKIFVKTAAGGNMKVRDLYEGDFFGEIALLSGKPRSATITASSATELLELDRETLEEIATRHPRVRDRVLEIYNKRANSAAEAMLRGIDEDEGAGETAAPVAAAQAAPEAPRDQYSGVELKDTALAMMRSTQWTDAAALWELYLMVAPSDTSARASLGLCMAKVGNWEGAVAAFEEATAANPMDASSFFSLAVAYSKLGKKAQSKAALENTLRADPSHAKAKAQLARM